MKKNLFAVLAIMVWIAGIPLISLALPADAPDKTSGELFKRSPGYYEEQAQRALGVIEAGEEKEGKTRAREKPWKIFGSYGFEYDDNVALQSTVQGFKVQGDRNAERFTLRNGLSYDYLVTSNARLGVSYTFSQSLHTDSLTAFNFRNHILQHNASYSTEVLGKPTNLGLKYSFSHGTLQNTTFASSNSFLPFVSIEPIENVMVSFYDYLSVSNFRNKGFNDDISSRDGLYNTTGMMNTFFFSKRKRSLSFSYEFGYNATEGDNFDARVYGARAVFKSPLFEKIRGEASFSFLDDEHYNYASLPRRHDYRFDYGTKLIRPIGKYLELRLFYTFTKVNNTHAGLLGQFDYSRNIAGGDVSFTY